MITELLNHIANQIIESNQFLDKICPIAFKLPDNTVVGYTTETEFEFVGISDQSNRAAYIRYEPEIQYTNPNRSFSSSKKFKLATVTGNLVVFSFSHDRFNSIMLGQKLSDDLQNISFSTYSGNEISIKINVKRVNTDPLKVYSNETGLIYDGATGYSAASVQFDLTYTTSEERCLNDCAVFEKYINCSIPSSTASIQCPPAIITDGEDEIEVGSGQRYTCQNGSVDVPISINETVYGNFNEATNIPILNSDSIPVGTVNPGLNVIIGDSTAVLKNTDETVLITTLIPAETSEDIIAPDGHVHIKKINDGTIANVFVPSGQTVNYNVADSIAVIKNSENTTIKTESIQATETENIILDDITITQKNSSNTTIAISVIAAGVDKNVTVPDTAIKNSAGTLQANAPSGVDYIVQNDTVRNSDSSTTYSDIVQGVVKVIPDITVTDPNGSTASYPAMKNYACTLIENLATQDLNDDLTPTQINQIQRQQPTKTGQTTSYRTGDDGDLEMGIGATFSTLSDNNIFGNTNRFTDETGAQTYTNNFVLDHLTGLMWYRVNQSGEWNAAIDNSLSSTQGGFNDWFLPNLNQLITIANVGNSTWLNYAPFNLSVSTTATTKWTSSTRAADTTQAHILSTNGTLSTVAKTGTTRSFIYCRQFIPSDFGL